MTFKIGDCVRRCANGKRSRLKGADESVYSEIWSAFNGWIRSQMEKKQGAKIPAFGTFKWIKTEGRGAEGQKVTLRPVFRLSDTFCKTYGLTNKGIESNRPTSKVKEINVYEVAIRYSNQLTKDTVFTGLKDVFQSIGEAAHSRTAVKLEFGDVGTLIVRECKATFVFEPEFEPYSMGEDEMHGEDDELLLLPAGSLPQLAAGASEAPLEVTASIVPPIALPLADVGNDTRRRKPKRRPQTSKTAAGKKAQGRGQPQQRENAAPALGVVGEQDYEECEEYLRRLYSEFTEHGGQLHDTAPAPRPGLFQLPSSRPCTASTTSTRVSYLDRDELLSPGAKQRMKRWVRHEGIREANAWSREPIDRHAPIKTPAPKSRRAKAGGTAAAGRLFLDDEPASRVVSRPRTAGSARRPRQDYL